MEKKLLQTSQSSLSSCLSPALSLVLVGKPVNKWMLNNCISAGDYRFPGLLLQNTAQILLHRVRTH